MGNINQVEGNMFQVVLRGRKNLYFTYSNNLTMVKIFDNETLVYEGKPIDEFKFPGDDLRVSLNWSGESVALSIKDNCTVSSIVSSLVN